MSEAEHIPSPKEIKRMKRKILRERIKRMRKTGKEFKGLADYEPHIYRLLLPGTHIFPETVERHGGE